MGMAGYIVFYASAVLYTFGALLAFLSLSQTKRTWQTLAGWITLAGAFCSLAALLFRWMEWGHLPLTTVADSLNLFAIISAAAMLFIVHRHRVPALWCFYLPPLATISIINALFAWQNFPIPPRPLNSLLLIGHVGLAFLGYALFFVAAMSSMAYLFQANRLKHHRTSGLFRHMPALEDLDTVLYRLVGYGYPSFVGTVVLGLIWAGLESQLLGVHWWLAPKVLMSYIIVIFYASLFHLHRRGVVRGPKLAWFIAGGFFVFILTYVVLSLLNLRVYHFWGAAS